MADPRDRAAPLDERSVVGVRVDEPVAKPALDDRERLDRLGSVQDPVDLAVIATVDQVAARRPHCRREAIRRPFRRGGDVVELEVQRPAVAGAPESVQDLGELGGGPGVVRAGGDAGSDLAQDRRAHEEPEAGVERPQTPEPAGVGPLLADRRQQVVQQPPGDAGVERLQLARPSVVVEERAVEIEHVGEVAAGRRGAYLPVVLPPRQGNEPYAHLPLGAIERRHLLLHRRALGRRGIVRIRGDVEPGGDVGRAVDPPIARRVGSPALRPAAVAAARDHPTGQDGDQR